MLNSSSWSFSYYSCWVCANWLEIFIKLLELLLKRFVSPVRINNGNSPITTNIILISNNSLNFYNSLQTLISWISL